MNNMLNCTKHAINIYRMKEGIVPQGRKIHESEANLIQIIPKGITLNAYKYDFDVPPCYQYGYYVVSKYYATQVLTVLKRVSNGGYLPAPFRTYDELLHYFSRLYVPSTKVFDENGNIVGCLGYECSYNNYEIAQRADENIRRQNYFF